MAILVTGGAGFIGSHTVVELQNAGYDVVVLDNLSYSSEKSLERVEKITGKPVKFYKVDILDREGLNEVFEKEDIDSCIHFAGLKAVGESVAKPWEYYENNIAGTLTLVDVMRKHNVNMQYNGMENQFRYFYPSLNKHNSSNYYVANASKKRNGNLNATFMMRMAEVYLIAAEADIYINGGANAMGYINKVRARAGAKALTGTATVRTVLDLSLIHI